MDINLRLKAIPNKGRMVYEYNPLYNYRLSANKDIVRGLVTHTIKKGSIVDLDTTTGLNFDLNHPVDILCLNSYDGSVNLILNDNKNTPKLINTRFTLRELNTYEVIDREGNNDTNIYDENSFESDASLYKRVNSMPTISLYKVSNSGNLLVGTYVFYLKYADADGNETDFVAESSIVLCFIGANGVPNLIDGGYRDQNSYKAITLKLHNLDKLYDYIKVYYSRATSDLDGNVYHSAKKIVHNYPIITTTACITITGNEEADDISLADLNIKYFQASSAKAQAQCQNRLFLGNVARPTPAHKELKDLSLHFIPTYHSVDLSELIGKLNGSYLDSSKSSAYQGTYFNMFNIYNYVGYWPEEIYRFGVVYILKDGTLSSVYNTLGCRELLSSLDTTLSTGKRYYDTVLNKCKTSQNTLTEHNFFAIDENDFYIDDDVKLNAKGVVKFPKFSESINNSTVLSIDFHLDKAIYKELTKYVKGFFFVRLKRIPTILALGLTLNMDNCASVPLLPDNWIESFLDRGTKSLSHSFSAHLRQLQSSDITDATINSNDVSNNTSACICPDYDTNPAFLNQIFTGSTFSTKVIGYAARPATKERLFDCTTVEYTTGLMQDGVAIAAVPDSAPAIVVNDHRFRARCGEETDAAKFRYAGHEDKTTNAENLIRGLWGPYLGLCKKFDQLSLINIYIPGYSEANIPLYFKERYEDNSEYCAIGNRHIIEDYMVEALEDYTERCYRGDSFMCTTTHRVNRNFQDPTAPTNDIIIESSTWKDNYDYWDEEKKQKINRGDVNAVKLGAWITTTVRSNRNICLRASDLSWPSEEGMFGHPRSFYPLYGISCDGDSKIPDSYAFNAGFGNTVGQRWNYTLPYMPAIKNTYQTRVAYSDIAIGDAFKNGYRTFISTNYRDYTFDYGSIIKLVEFNSNLLVVFEHGVGLLPINERLVAAQGDGGAAFINQNNILPDTPKIISDMYGSQWADSIIKTPKYVYGVDTVAKKIWRTDGVNLACISDFKVQSFLNQNISLSEFEMTPIIGIRNVKTHYNAFKLDIMFTFYDLTKGMQETAWNLCFNELQDKFITFYSWIPSFSENINNIYFSFDRNTSKLFSGFAYSSTNAPEGMNITVDKFNLKDWSNNAATLSIKGRSLPEYKSDETITELEYSLIRDPWGFCNNFTISNNLLRLNNDSRLLVDKKEAIYLYVQCKIYTQTPNKIGAPVKTIYAIILDMLILTSDYDQFTNPTGVDLQYVPESKLNIDQLPVNTTWFWKHGQSGLFDNAEKIRPTKWYGLQHPFEFEVIVADKPSMHKIFDTLRIMSNKAAPESFHYEVVGEVYDWSDDKENMYYRLEATKCLYQLLGSDITYDYKYLEEVNAMYDLLHVPIEAVIEAQSNYANNPNNTTLATLKLATLNLRQQARLHHKYGFPIQTVKDALEYTVSKSTLFPFTYSRKDSLLTVYDDYIFGPDIYNEWASKNGLSYDYRFLSGSEITHDKISNEFRVWTHAEALDINKVGRLRGNMNYKEDMWDIQINSTIFVQKNEPTWKKCLPPIAVVGKLPNDIKSVSVTDNLLNPYQDVKYSNSILNYDLSKYDHTMIDTTKWTARKETRMRDKYLRVRVRYSGEDLALINSLITQYTISYA